MDSKSVASKSQVELRRAESSSDGLVPLNALETSTDSVATRRFSEKFPEPSNQWERFKLDKIADGTIDQILDSMLLMMRAENAQSEEDNARDRMRGQDRYEKATAEMAASLRAVTPWLLQAAQASATAGHAKDTYYGKQNSVWGVAAGLAQPFLGMQGNSSQATRTELQAQQTLAQGAISSAQSRERSSTEEKRDNYNTLEAVWRGRADAKRAMAN